MEILEANPGEFAELFNTILINVTSLLRDPEAWTALVDTVLPSLVAAKASGGLRPAVAARCPSRTAGPGPPRPAGGQGPGPAIWACRNGGRIRLWSCA